MNPEKDKEFDQNMNQLVWLLKKILKNVPGMAGQGPMPQMPFQGKGDQGVNLNLFFFTFLPMAPEEFDELEEIYDQYFFNEDKEDLSSEISPADLDFLRRNGIRF